MTLLITVFAAVIATVKWYNDKDKKMHLGFLCDMYWTASIMWFVDALFEYFEDGVDYFKPEFADMVNDAFLGLSVVALGLVIWVIILLVSDPNGRVKALFKKDKETA